MISIQTILCLKIKSVWFHLCLYVLWFQVLRNLINKLSLLFSKSIISGRTDAPHAEAVPATAEVTAEPETGPASAGLKPDSAHHPAEEEEEVLEVEAQFRQSGIRVMWTQSSISGMFGVPARILRWPRRRGMPGLSSVCSWASAVGK